MRQVLDRRTEEAGIDERPLGKQRVEGMKSAKFIVFWDYDTQWGADRSWYPRVRDWGYLEFEYTERLLELHATYNVPACFAVVGAAALPGTRPYHDPAQIRQIHAAGHEVASHSFHHEWLPGLDRKSLLETLRRSKDSLEQCIGGPVVSFVPPYNQPHDYPQGFSFSWSERRGAGRERTDLYRLCDALRETGYRCCRVAYQSIHLRVAERLLKRSLHRPSYPGTIAGVTCLRVNTPCGFDPGAVAMLNRCVAEGGLVVVYGHPHSLRSGNSQDENWLVPFLKRVQGLQRDGLIRTCLPRDLVDLN